MSTSRFRQGLAQIRARGGLGNVLGEAFFPVPSEVAAETDPDTLKALRRQAMIQMGLGMMAARDRGAGLGQGLQFGMGAGQQAVQEALNSILTTRKDKRADRRLDLQDQRQDAYDARVARMEERSISERAEDIAYRKERDAAMDASRKRDDDRADRQLRALEGGGRSPVNYQIITRPVGNGLVQDFSRDPRTGERVPEGEPYKPVTAYTGNVQEGERKAATLGIRLEGALNVLDELEKVKPGAGSPGVLEKVLQAIGADTAANFARGSKRQQAQAAQLDALDAALTLATGAAYTAEQLKGQWISYFPQLGDSEETKASKRRRFGTLVEAARVSAGRAQPSIDQALYGGPARPGQPRPDLNPGAEKPNELDDLMGKYGRPRG